MAINNKKLNALSFISMLVVSIFAFGYLIGGEIKTVSAADSTTPTIKVLKAGSTTEYVQIPQEIYVAANSAANGDPARTSVLLGIWNSESGGYYNAQGERAFSWSSAKAGAQDAIGSSWFSGISPFKSVGPWEQQISNYQAYYSSVNGGETISYSQAQNVLTSDVNEAARSANWQIDKSITSIQQKYSSSGREFSLSDSVVQEAVAMDYNAGLGRSSTAANQIVIEDAANRYGLDLDPGFLVDGKNGAATYAAMADSYSSIAGNKQIDAQYAEAHYSDVMNSLRTDYSSANNKPAPLVAKIEDTPGKADASDYAYNVGRSTQSIQSQIAPSETSVALSNVLASQTAPTTGITLPPADFSATASSTDSTPVSSTDSASTQLQNAQATIDQAQKTRMLSASDADIAASQSQLSEAATILNNEQVGDILNNNEDYASLSAQQKNLLAEKGIGASEFAGFQEGSFYYDQTAGELTDLSFPNAVAPSSNAGLPSNLGYIDVYPNIAQYGGDYVYSSPSGSSFLWNENAGRWDEVPNELYAGKTAQYPFKGTSDSSSDVQVEITDAAAPSAISAGLANTPSAIGSFSTLADRDKIGSLIDSKKSWTSLTEADKTYLTSQGYDSASWNSGISSQKPASFNRGTMDVWGMKMPFAVGQLAQGLSWSLAAVAAIQVLAPIFGVSKEETNALSAASVAGIMAGKLSYSLLGNGGAFGMTSSGSKTANFFGSKYFSGGVGIVVAWLTYNAMYKKENTQTKTVNFQCLPWQAPRGGSDCELCNDGGLPCSEYRCKSLGQSCKLINEGTAVEKCINANPRDVSPPIISPWTQILTSGYRYEGKSSPPGPGVKIVANTSNGCLRAFQAIQFGVVTNEPSQCKIDIASTKNYSDMATFMGGDNLYTYNHSEFLSLPRATDFANSSIKLENGKEMNLFVRCKDANGNLNSAEYIVNVCVDPTPDNTVPEIKATSIKSGNCVAANTDNTTVEFYTDEPSTCKWSFTDKDYSTMDYNMSCSSNVYEVNAMQLYTCSALMTGIARDGTNYYVKCEDQPNAPENERNRNMESYQFSLRGSNPLKLLSIKPNQTIYGAVRPTPVELYTQTLYGCEDNKAVCFYSLENANNYVQFYDTDKVDGIHTQRLDLQDGLHTVYVKCVDAGGNLAENTTSFNLEIDTNSPIVARVYQEDTYLKIVTQRNSECVYTNTNCDYLFQEGTTMPYANTTTHVTPWFSDKSYYIKCRDEFRNEPTDCSTIVRPTDNFL